jgi:hypothetical protein
MMEHAILAASEAAAARIPETIAAWVREHPAIGGEPLAVAVPAVEGGA